MPKIDEIFNPNTILDYLQNREYPVMLGEQLFPDRKIQDLSFEYLKGANNLPVMATIHAFDTEAEIASRDELSKVAAELALIKRKIRMNEKLIIQLNKPRDNQEKQYAIKQIFNDIDNMVMAVKSRTEAMRMELISTGKLDIDENDVKLTLDYGVPADHKEALSGTSVWTDPGATPLDDIYRWVDKIVNDTGTTPTRALTSRAVVNALMKHETVRKAIFGVNSDRIVTLQLLNQLMASMDLPVIATYDERARVQLPNGTYSTVRYFSEDTFVVLPSGILGESIFGLTAEEIELSSDASVDMTKVGNILAVVYKTKDPVARWTKAVATMLPSLPVADQIYIAQVK